MTGGKAKRRGGEERRGGGDGAAIRKVGYSVTTMRKTVLAPALLLTLGLAAALAAAPPKMLSPPGTATLHLEGATVTITYHRPEIRNPRPPHHPRLIFGPGSKYLVPFGQVWRLGANQATALTTSAPVTLAGEHLAAGSYTLFAIPEAHHWTLIISKKTGEWGIPYPGRQDDLARKEIPTHRLASLVDPFTISLHKTSARTAEVRFAWEHTLALAPLRVK